MNESRAGWVGLLFGGVIACERGSAPPPTPPQEPSAIGSDDAAAPSHDSSEGAWPRHPALTAVLQRHEHRIVDVSPLMPLHVIVQEVALGDVDGDGRRDLYARHGDEILVWLATTLRSREQGPSLRYRIPDDGVYLPTPVAPWWTYRSSADMLRIVDPGSGDTQELEGCAIHRVGDIDGDGRDEAWLGLDISPSIFTVPRLDPGGPPWFATVEQADWFNPVPGFRLCDGPLLDVEGPQGTEVLVVIPEFPIETEPTHSHYGRAWRLFPALDIDEAEFDRHALERPEAVPPDESFGALAAVLGDTAVLGASWDHDGDLALHLQSYGPGDRDGAPSLTGRIPHAFEGHWDGLRRTSVDALGIEDFDGDGELDLALVEERREFKPLRGDWPGDRVELADATVEDIPKACAETLGYDYLETVYPLHHRIAVVFGPLKLDAFDEAAIDESIDYLCPTE